MRQPLESPSIYCGECQCKSTLSLSFKLEVKFRGMAETTIKITVFHAHIYYDAVSRDQAACVRSGLSAKFDVQLGRWHDNPIGPHPKGMYQVLFSPNQFGEVVPWLMLNREDLDILVHPETGDDVADHTKNSLWLGEKLELNIEFLRRIRTT